MKYRLFLWLFLLGALAACKDDEEIRFDVPVEFRQPLTFREIPGGAVMKYYLPQNTDIFGVRVRYTDAFGNLLVKEGSYLGDSIVLSGFTEARTNVPAQVTFFNSNMVESEPLDITFNTQHSATWALFDDLKVNPFWGGFNITYQSPETVSGMLHIFYIGKNPKTQELDSILMGSMPIAEGGDTLNYVLQQVMDSTDVIVRTDDFKGYRVKQQIFHNLPCLSMDTLKNGDFEFDFTGKVVENEEYQFGRKYLFDGDSKGVAYRKNRLAGNRYQYATFVAGPDAFGERFIIDLKTEKIPASLRLYAILNYRTSWPFRGPSAAIVMPEIPCAVWEGYYTSRLPCKVKLYGTNQDPRKVDITECALLFTLDDDPTGFRKSWATRTDSYYGTGDNFYEATDEEIKAAEPIYLDMLCNYTGDKYRYLIFVVTDTYNGDQYGVGREENNYNEYITFSELEVCIKAEEK